MLFAVLTICVGGDASMQVSELLLPIAELSLHLPPLRAELLHAGAVGDGGAAGAADAAAAAAGAAAAAAAASPAGGLSHEPRAGGQASAFQPVGDGAGASAAADGLRGVPSPARK